MTVRIVALGLLAAASVSTAAVAQVNLNNRVDGGLHFHVAAPQGASWALECQFRPVVVSGVHYNRISHTGSGPMAGRLPSDHGRCELKKTGGNGPVGVALVKNGEATAAGSNDPAKPAFIDVF